MDDYIDETLNIQVVDMDVKIPEQISRNADGSYTIFLNARFSHEYRMKSYEHAIRHIKNGDFDREDGNVQKIESVAHNFSVIKGAPAPYRMSPEKKQKRLAEIRRKREQIALKLEGLETFISIQGQINISGELQRVENYKLYRNGL